MSIAFETLHPRGQAANAGQFREKTTSAPTGALSEGGAAAQLSRHEAHASIISSLSFASDRAVARAQGERLLAIAARSVPEGATHLEVEFDEDDPEYEYGNNYPRDLTFVDARGEFLDDLAEDSEMYDVSSDLLMGDSGFSWVEGKTWRMELRPPKMDREFAPEATRAVTHVCHLEYATGQSGTGFAAALVTAAGADSAAQMKLADLDETKAKALAAKYEALLGQLRTEIEAL